MAQREVVQVKFAASIRLNNREVSHFSTKSTDPKLLSALYDNDIGAVIITDLRAKKEVVVPLANVVYVELDLEQQQPECSGDKGSKRPASNA